MAVTKARGSAIVPAGNQPTAIPSPVFGTTGPGPSVDVGAWGVSAGAVVGRSVARGDGSATNAGSEGFGSDG